MKSLTKLVAITLLSLTLLSTAAFSGENKFHDGYRIYMKNIKNQCNSKLDSDFTKAFTSKEWTDAYEAGKFEAKVKEVCPNMTKYKEKWTERLYKFANEYALDGNDRHWY